MSLKPNLLVIRSSNIHRAVTFYQQVGLVFHLHSHGEGIEHFSAEVDGFVFEIYPSVDGVTTTGTRLGFSVDCVDDVVERLVRLGVTVVAAPADFPWGRRAVLLDFDGHRVEFTAALR